MPMPTSIAVMPPIGPFVDAAGRSCFRVFAPERRSVALRLSSEAAARPMQADASGHWSIALDALPAGTRYRFEADGRTCPDPASRRQPDGVHGDSMLVAPRRARRDGWRGVAVADAIIYELHLGTFTPEGTLAAAMAKLPYLHTLGITVIELLPIAAFPGERGWGYDGTYPFALHAPYGSYDDLAGFIEAAHAFGFAVLLDIVHNHFGPEGNYSAVLARYTQPAATPWGAAVNLDGDFSAGVRAFFLENLRYWLQDIGFDGFRMDAVAMMFDTTPVHLLREFSDLAHAIGRTEGRHVLMIAEHLRNDKLVTSPRGFRFDSQWSDDLNHALVAFLTGERDRHCANFGSFADVLTALSKGFVLDGTRFDVYRGCKVGSDPGEMRATEQVVYIQNHDQVGNRPFGDRMIATHGRAMALLGITAVMASPFVPMLFMGEEYGETAPFLFFEDFGDPALVEAVRVGRRAAYDFGDRPSPEPHDRTTFLASKLVWQRTESDDGRGVLAYYRTLIALKRSGELGPRERSAVKFSADARTGLVCAASPRTLTFLNLAPEPRAIAVPSECDLVIASVAFDLDDRLGAYGAAIYRRR